MAKILIVEDNVELATILTNWLEAQSHVVDMVHTGEDSLQLVGNFTYDLIILDWELPGMEGLKVCEKFRKSGGTTPILFLTGRADVTSRITGLDYGADDYLPKPFEFPELSARVRSLLRRPPGYVPTMLSVLGIALEVESRTANVGGKQIQLTPREFSLLEFLLRHPNRTFSSKALLDAVWPLDSALSEDTVRSCMRTLRKKITVNNDECVIKTVQGYGYVIETKEK